MKHINAAEFRIVTAAFCNSKIYSRSAFKIHAKSTKNHVLYSCKIFVLPRNIHNYRKNRHRRKLNKNHRNVAFNNRGKFLWRHLKKQKYEEYGPTHKHQWRSQAMPLGELETPQTYKKITLNVFSQNLKFTIDPREMKKNHPYQSSSFLKMNNPHKLVFLATPLVSIGAVQHARQQCARSA